MGCRKNQASLTSAERTAFVNAVVKLKTVMPSQLHPGDPNLHRYDDYVETHMNAMMHPDGTNRVPGWAHQGSAFFPWHREMLRHFELDLQAIDPSVTLPYWDWTVDQANTGAPWTDDFMGAIAAATDEVATGPFRSAVWVKKVFEPGDNEPKLRRALGRVALDPTGEVVPNLPSHDQVYGVAGALTEVPYDHATWRGGVSPSFRDRAEGWHGLGSIHNRVHLWVGGSMLPSTSPNDPIFFLHHCNVDRLLSQWQQQHPGETYHPTGTAGEVGDPGHNLNQAMIFNDPGQPAPWAPTSTTPAQVWNHHLPPSGYWYDTDPPEVELLTLTVSFVDIPEGLGGAGITTYRPVRFAVRSCAGATFHITAGPSAPFTAPLGTTFTVGEAHGGPAAEARVWIGYTSTAAGATAAGSVTVHCVETNKDFVVPLTANTVPRPKTAMALVLDHSGSMTEDAGDGHPKVEKLKTAVGTFVDLMLPGDGLAMVRFDDTAQTLFGVTDVGPVSPASPGSGRDQAQTVLVGSQLDPAGATSIGAGVLAGKLALGAAPATTPPWAVRAMLVVTDGVQNTAPLIADAAASLSANTFAVGIGTPANISVAALDQLTQGHGGYLVVTGTITPDQTFRLTKYFLQALAGMTNTQVVVDPQGELVWGAEYRIPFSLVEPDIGADIVLLCPAAAAVEMVLETPGGEIITPATAAAEAGIEFVRKADHAFYRLSLPALSALPADSGPGPWNVVLRLGRDDKQRRIQAAAVSARRSVPFSVLVHAYSTLRMTATVTQKSREPGAEIKVQATLTEYDVPVEQRATVWGEVTASDGASISLALTEDAPGRFAGAFIASTTGLYTVRLRATGSTFGGRRFEREQTLTAASLPGGDRPQPGDPGATGQPGDGDDRLCALLKRLAERTCQCIEQYCRRAGHLGGQAPRRAAQAPPVKPPDQPARPPDRTPGEDAIATLPEPEPNAPAEPDPQDHGMAMGATMFGLSPEDIATGEPPQAASAEPQPPDAPADHPKPSSQHGLSPEDQAHGAD